MLDIGICHTLRSVSAVLCYYHACLKECSDEGIGVHIFHIFPELNSSNIVMSVGWSKAQSIEGEIMFIQEEHT
jgi:hypothetical protein